MTKRLFGLFVLGSLAGCAQIIGANDYESIDPPVDGSIASETSVDTGTPADSTIVDSGEADSTLVDSGEADSTVTDSSVDSTIADTFVADTFVADTFKPDTFVPDTFVPDTFVADTKPADTCVATTEICNGLDDNCDGTPDNAGITAMCPITSGHIASATCAGIAGCKVGGCDLGWSDFNGLWSDGCECQQFATKHTCGDAEAAGAISVGPGPATLIQGNLTQTSRDDWYNINFAPGGHPLVELSVNPGGALRIDVIGSCGSGVFGCGTEGGGAGSITSWDTYPSTGTQGMITSVRVRVFRPSGALDCATYTLRIAD